MDHTMYFQTNSVINYNLQLIVFIVNLVRQLEEA